MKITLKQLQLFVNTVKFGSMSEGAKHCHITQSGASLALGELEKLLGFPLFDRHGKKIRLNHKGKQLLGRAMTVLDIVQEIESYTQGPVEMRVGELVVGASSTIGNYLLPSYLSQFNQKYPKINIDCKIANTHQIIKDLKQFRLDIGYIEGICDEEDIERQIWQHDELVIFSRFNHPLAVKNSLSMQELSHYSWALREAHSGTRESFEGAVRAVFIPEIAITLESSEALKRYVADSDCLSCLSRRIIEPEILNKKLKIIRVNDFSLRRPLYRILNKNKYHTQIGQLFENFLKTFGR